MTVLSTSNWVITIAPGPMTPMLCSFYLVSMHSPRNTIYDHLTHLTHPFYEASTFLRCLKLTIHHAPHVPRFDQTVTIEPCTPFLFNFWYKTIFFCCFPAAFLLCVLEHEYCSRHSHCHLKLAYKVSDVVDRIKIHIIISSTEQVMSEK